LADTLLVREQAVQAWARFHVHVQRLLLDRTGVPPELMNVENHLRVMEEQLTARVEAFHPQLRAK
jgi:hypothetical protein